MSMSEAKARWAQFMALADEEITVDEGGGRVVVVVQGIKVAEYQTIGIVADQPTMLAAANEYAAVLRCRFIALAMGTLTEHEAPWPAGSTRVKSRRVALGMSQRQLADQCGINQGTVSRVEAGASPHPDVKRRLADALSQTVEDLFPTTGDVSP